MTEPIRKTLPLSDGEVSCLAWENEGPLLHFAHATGFNAETYRRLLGPLAKRFRIIASDQRGHGFSTLPATPGLARGWNVYRDDLLRILDALARGPAILAGHSMGATVSLMAAVLRPDMVRGLVLIEPVMVPAAARFAIRMARWLGLDLGMDIAVRAAQRRDVFPSFDAALAADTGRGAFKTWPKETVADYLRGGLVADPQSGGVRLACAPAWEAETFRAAPFGKARLARLLECPVTLVKGTVASTCPAIEASIFQRAGAHVVRAHGASHFLPMEYPDLVRHEIARLADGL